MEFTAIDDRILIGAEKLFFSYGFTKSTSEDIAREASVSKRTLYKYFNSKRHILQALINKKTKMLSVELNQIIESNTSFPEKLHTAMSVTTIFLSKVSRHFIEDIQRNVPDVWQKISDYRRDMVNTVFLSLLNEGIKTGYVKKKINKSVTMLVMLSIMESLINASADKTLPTDLSKEIPQSIDNIFGEMLNIIYNGILNDTTVLSK